MSKTAAVRRLALEMGLTERTVWTSLAAGMPFGEDGSYDVKQCIAWRQSRGLKPGSVVRVPAAAVPTSPAADAVDDSELHRFRAARADEVELRVQRMRSRTVDVDEACAAIARRFGVVRRCMLAIPEALADLLTFEQRSALRAEIDRALFAISQDPKAVAREAAVQA